ncbi:class I SAM-dependent methyltransferase [Methylobacterium sp. J-068]|uniref:class I SAM-dependent methyltransferase n=1 Tax=Methylobacterium sp. J-068 TaxID=2836649 RepID=UPI001FBAA4B0|nr:class I SAM-dependent methyltransferase [Methylobacterium sp. J-068]MCJ2035232.1 class I SAM-dependent methyltransferase [Methylobacterium sp. J-068]
MVAKAAIPPALSLLEANDLEVGLGPNHMLTGRFTGKKIASRVTLACNGRHWATVPVTTTDGAATFACQLPPERISEDTTVEIRGSSERDLLARLTVGPREPIVNGFGLTAGEVLAVHPLPFQAAPWIRFDGARLTITGEHLPPAGDPGALRVVFGPGVAYEVQYPLPSLSFGNHFWYWPNAHLSAFTVTIDLPACAPDSDPFAFAFEYDNGNPLALDGRQVGDVLGRRIFVPTNLGAGIGLPRDADQLTRVQTWSNDQSVTFTGHCAFKAIETLFNRYGVADRDDVSILDWGCGHGRVTRHFIQQWRRATVCGTDIDDENISWCRENLLGRFVTTPLMPPAPYEDASVQGIFGISVMTHLTAEVQAAWLDEIARILKPDGVALITFGGSSSVAWSSVFRAPDFWRYWTSNGFDDRLVDPALDGKISDPTYYRHTVQTVDYTRRVWSRHLDVVDIIPEFIGNLDVAVLRKRQRA